MKIKQYVAATALVSALALGGCSKSQTETQPADTGNASPPAAADMQDAAAPTDPASPLGTTNDAPAEPASAASQFTTASLASPFAQSELGLKESYNRALIAFQIADYSRAASELQDLEDTPDLTPPQKQAVQDLLAKTLKLAPDLAATNAAARREARNPEPTEFPLAAAQASPPPQNLPENPFSTADPAVRDTFARAKAAYAIGSYDAALAELQELATNAQLNWQQKYTVQELLAKTSQNSPPAPAAAAQPPKR